jgi:hypothetical protein
MPFTKLTKFIQWKCFLADDDIVSAHITDTIYIFHLSFESNAAP